MKFIIIFFLFSLKVYGSVAWPEIIEKIYENPEKYSLPIYGGASNSNYDLTVGEKHYFVRFSPKGNERFYANPAIEYDVLNLLSKEGISPKPFYYDSEKKILVMEFIHETQAKIDLLEPSIRSEVLSLLRKIEDANIVIERTFDSYEDVMRFINLSEIPFSEEFHSVLLPALKSINRILSKSTKKSLCHLDLHSKNVLKNENRLWIIDWEYATMSHPFLTLASMASIERWDDEQMQTLLKEYMSNPKDEDIYLLYLYRIVIDIYWAAWNHVQAQYSTLEQPYALWEKLFYDEALKRIHSEKYIYLVKEELATCSHVNIVD